MSTTARIITNDNTVVEFFSRYGKVEESESEICLDWSEGERGIFRKVDLEGKEGYPTKNVYYFTMKEVHVSRRIRSSGRQKETSTSMISAQIISDTLTGVLAHSGAFVD
jgi:hypothetical protein